MKVPPISGKPMRRNSRTLSGLTESGFLSAGFSLVEVTLAIGIVAFAFLSILAMLPVGLATFDRAVNATVEARIAQQIFSDAQQVKFEDLGDTAGRSYFDAEGRLLGTGGTAPDGWVYNAVVNPPASKFSASQFTSTVTVDIAKNRRVDAALKNERGAVRTFVFVVADVGL